MVVPIAWRPDSSGVERPVDEHEVLTRNLEKRIASNWWAFGAIFVFLVLDWILYFVLKVWVGASHAQLIAVGVALTGAIPSGLLGEYLREVLNREAK